MSALLSTDQLFTVIFFGSNSHLKEFLETLHAPWNCVAEIYRLPLAQSCQRIVLITIH